MIYLKYDFKYRAYKQHSLDYKSLKVNRLLFKILYLVLLNKI